ncbi:MAG: AAA family ATPase [Acidimicrobiia bacterium]
MRPVSVELEGFSAYRSRQHLDLDGVDFFSLSGPTGSGKSSLIDAMIFALYGRIPRLDARAVAPVISAGADVARVAFTFEILDEIYVAVRMAQRTKNGATTPEARLVRGEEVLVSGAREVTDAVEELLGLAFDDFTRTVVLPQGEFARFLTSQPAERQALLKKLLRIDYSRVRELARAREAVAVSRAEEAERRLEELEIPTPEAIEAAKSRLVLLEELHRDVPEAEADLQKRKSALEAAEKGVVELTDALRRLEALAVPPDLDQLDHKLRAAEEKLEQGEKELDQARRALTAVEETRAKLPPAETVATDRRLHLDLAEVGRQLAELKIEEARGAVREANRDLQAAEEEQRRARAAVREAERTHAAHALRATLVQGEPCPVCDREVTEVPSGGQPARLEELRLEVEEAERRVTDSSRAAQKAREGLVRLEEQEKALKARHQELLERLADRPSLSELDELEARIAAAEDARKNAAERLDAAERYARGARSALEDLAEAAASVTRKLIEARDTVSDLSPPLPEGDDPVVGWKEFLAWRDHRMEEVAQEKEAAVVGVEKAAEAVNAARRVLEARLAKVEVEATEPYAATVATELERTRTLVARQTEALELEARLTTDVKRAAEEARVARELAKHLRSDRFERWLMAGAVAELVTEANQLLAQLSSGSYSLHSDETGGFSVVDHLNADELRPVATLSGGETFLVSLALALSLAEKVSAAGGAALEAIILDEGFGTLDEESLDIVASVLEALTAKGLMVGVITHVKELASRAPDRFEVTAGPSGAEVRRVS